MAFENAGDERDFMTGPLKPNGVTSSFQVQYVLRLRRKVPDIRSGVHRGVCRPQRVSALHPLLHPDQHLQHGHRVPRPAGLAHQDGRDQQLGF